MQTRPASTRPTPPVTFESKAVRAAASNGRITEAEADRIGSTYAIAGTIDSDEGFAIKRDVNKLLAGQTSVAVSFQALAKLQAAVDGPQWF